jgi:hypothetical protein
MSFWDSFFNASLIKRKIQIEYVSDSSVARIIFGGKRVKMDRCILTKFE